jgi:hypothetical protein
MAPTDMVPAALAPRLDIIFENLPQVRTEKGRKFLFQWFDHVYNVLEKMVGGSLLTQAQSFCDAPFLKQCRQTWQKMLQHV